MARPKGRTFVERFMRDEQIMKHYAQGLDATQIAEKMGLQRYLINRVLRTNRPNLPMIQEVPVNAAIPSRMQDDLNRAEQMAWEHFYRSASSTVALALRKRPEDELTEEQKRLRDEQTDVFAGDPRWLRIILDIYQKREDLRRTQGGSEQKRTLIREIVIEATEQIIDVEPEDEDGDERLLSAAS